MTAAFYIGSTETVQSCVHRQPEPNQPDPRKEGVHLFGFMVASRHCQGMFVRENSEAIVAVATIVLVGVTGGLAYYTAKLWGATNRLAQEAKASSQQTVTQMERTADAALRSADAARDSIELARITSQKELRAYVSTTTIGIAVAHVVSRPGVLAGWQIEPVFKNCGATPALNVAVWVNIDVRRGGFPDDFAFADIAKPASMSYGALGPGVEIRGSFVRLPVAAAALIHSGQAQGRVWGRVEYTDTVTPDAPKRITEFAGEVVLRIDPSIPGSGPDFKILERHNRMT